MAMLFADPVDSTAPSTRIAPKATEQRNRLVDKQIRYILATAAVESTLGHRGPGCPATDAR
ncbi:hypothetical protein A5760_24000 [Mycobacterium colombiense]|uniref:Uncharacterized protein n=1 Tax=Mycobacterium colombiense TaxID=339268 RepID=A0A1A0VYW8_9MYCO|nr:hypothetical protein A5760_24000 [Mycobacterium colombiense]